MRLIILRHGKAGTNSSSGRDEDRALKPRGERQAEFVGQRLSGDGTRPALILASRFERAFTTARIVQRLVGCQLQTVPELESGKHPSDAVELLGNHTADPLVFVGHNPQLSELVWLLVHGAPAEEAGLRTGEAVVLEVNHHEPIGTAKLLERIRMDDGE